MLLLSVFGTAKRPLVWVEVANLSKRAQLAGTILRKFLGK
jgi:hypothetical protein